MNKEHNDESTVRVCTSGSCIPERKDLSQHPFVTSGLKLKLDVVEKVFSILLLLTGIYLGCLIFILLPSNPKLGASYKAFVMTLLAGLFVWLVRCAAAWWVKERALIVKYFHSQFMSEKEQIATLFKEVERKSKHGSLSLLALACPSVFFAAID
ncbi:hypothetical protein [Maridesulfovibrio zosterae]|uniref:hypothetical protein n=1 Tax=Maridesulfovibrio zosterae TaxID=82171 RepID=UPI00048989AF|nr:hypothetical protein [Maridesulfovibrio zosterae]